jgi:hypothetical protein
MLLAVPLPVLPVALAQIAGCAPCRGDNSDIVNANCYTAHNDVPPSPGEDNFGGAGTILLVPEAGCSAPADASACSACAATACCTEAMACPPGTSCEGLDACIRENCASCFTPDPDGGAP